MKLSWSYLFGASVSGLLITGVVITEPPVGKDLLETTRSLTPPSNWCRRWSKAEVAGDLLVVQYLCCSKYELQLHIYVRSFQMMIYCITGFRLFEIVID